MIEVGEWIRTRAGHIHKITKICPHYENEKLVYEEQIVELEGKHSGWKVYQLESIIANHSKNIIDLIEEGDYVNGYKVLEKTKIKDNQMQICILKDNNSSNWRTINDKTLKSIVTKEQFKSIEYRLE